MALFLHPNCMACKNSCKQWCGTGIEFIVVKCKGIDFVDSIKTDNSDDNKRETKEGR